MQIDDKLRSEIEQIITSRFGEGVVKNIEIHSVEVFETTAEIKILVTFEASADLNALAEGYFGLTRKIRSVFDAEWGDVFPVITPVIGREAHA